MASRVGFAVVAPIVYADDTGVALFTGGDRSQSVRCWDIRAKAVVYELGTGNNRVCALNWDAKRSALYAATECDYMDRNGYTHDYRHARIPRWAHPNPDDVDMDDEDGDGHEEDEYDSMDEDDDEHNWPKNAYHNESFFGYAYDAGEHVLRESSTVRPVVQDY